MAYRWLTVYVIYITFINTYFSERRWKYPASNLRRRKPFYPILHSNWKKQVLFLVQGTITYTSENQVITFSCIFISVNNLWVGSLCQSTMVLFFIIPASSKSAKKYHSFPHLKMCTKLSAVPSLNVTISLIYFGIISSAGMIEFALLREKIFLAFFWELLRLQMAFMLSFFFLPAARWQQLRHISLC